MGTTASTTTDPLPLPPLTTTPKPSTIPLPIPATTPPPKPPQLYHHHHQNPYQFFPPHLGKPSDTIHYPLPYSGPGLISTTHPTPTGGGTGGGGIHPQLPEPGIPVYPQMPGSGNHANSKAHPSINLHSHVISPSFLHHNPSQSNALPSSHLSVAVTASTGVPFSNVHHPLSKVGSSPYSVPVSNAPKNLIDKKPDVLLVTFRDRKVRASDRASLYALCRSWLRNGYPEEIQLRCGDVLMSLPKPLPVLGSLSPKRKECNDDSEIDEVVTNETSAEELLTRHVKRAKRVRARLREERSQRIARYKSRLTLLLPPNGTIQE